MAKKILFFFSLLILVASVFLIYRGKGQKLVNACGIENFSESLEFDTRTAIFEGKEFGAPQIVSEEGNLKVLGSQNTSDKWIEVDLSEQKLRAWEGSNLYLETLVSTGLPWWPTPTGEFRVWVKLRYKSMEGGTGRYYYNLPNVPYVMFFSNEKVPAGKGYGLHGTYWHNNFGTRRSHGCVNLPTNIAEKLYYWISPILPDGKRSAYSNNDNPGTRIIIHE